MHFLDQLSDMPTFTVSPDRFLTFVLMFYVNAVDSRLSGLKWHDGDRITKKKKGEINTFTQSFALINIVWPLSTGPTLQMFPVNCIF